MANQAHTTRAALPPWHPESLKQRAAQMRREDQRGAVITLVMIAIAIAPELWLAYYNRPLPEVYRSDGHRFDYRIALNQANELELQQLPGVGPKLAVEIVENREAEGPFESPWDLIRVKGMGPTRTRAVMPYVLGGDAPEPEGWGKPARRSRKRKGKDTAQSAIR